MLEIKTTDLGAELISIKHNGEEKLHQGQFYWKRHAPILFPIVGQIKNGKTKINKKINEIIGENKETNKETLEKFPFEFELYIEYIINEDELITRYNVINKSDIQMPFGIGGHPAFICDYTTENYQIQFNKTEDKIEFLKLENGLISNKKAQNILKENIIELKKNIFVDDAIIMKNINSNKVTLYNKKDMKKELDFDFTGFPYLALWSKVGAPFVCIEPWYNTADTIESKGEFVEKENILKLNPKEEFKCEYKVEFF